MNAGRIVALTLGALVLGFGGAFLLRGSAAPWRPAEESPAAIAAGPSEPVGARSDRGADPRPGAVKLRAAAPAEAEVVTDPRSKGYDPTKLLDLGVRAAEIFAKESREAPWAEAFERPLQTALSSDLSVMIPGASVSEVTCRSTTCRVDFEAAEADGDRTMRAVQLVPLADRTAYEHEMVEGRFKGRMYLFYTDSHDPAVHQQRYADARKERLKEMVPGEGRLAGIQQIPSE